MTIVAQGYEDATREIEVASDTTVMVEVPLTAPPAP